MKVEISNMERPLTLSELPGSVQMKNCTFSSLVSFYLWQKRKCLYFLIHSLAILGFLPILVHFTVTSQESHTFAPGLCHVSKLNSYGFTSFYFSATSSRYATVTSCCIHQHFPLPMSALIRELSAWHL